MVRRSAVLLAVLAAIVGVPRRPLTQRRRRSSSPSISRRRRRGHHSGDAGVLDRPKRPLRCPVADLPDRHRRLEGMLAVVEAGPSQGRSAHRAGKARDDGPPRRHHRLHVDDRRRCSGASEAGRTRCRLVERAGNCRQRRRPTPPADPASAISSTGSRNGASSPYTTAQTGRQVTISGEGVTPVQFRAVDRAGNVSGWSATALFRSTPRCRVCRRSPQSTDSWSWSNAASQTITAQSSSSGGCPFTWSTAQPTRSPPSRPLGADRIAGDHQPRRHHACPVPRRRRSRERERLDGAGDRRA